MYTTVTLSDSIKIDLNLLHKEQIFQVEWLNVALCLFGNFMRNI